LVEVGDVIDRGDALALVGSTGRSTGPHVHFEVYKNGRVVDPASYIRRTVR
jgi:murein DD-endopeptidase MepM/ murein hydrolase activator NlpD